jgi:hypothetical protein
MSTNISYASINARNIMGMWLLDKGQGDVAKDSSGNGNDGKIVGAKWTDGKFGKGLEFDGVSHVEIPASKTTDDIYNGFTYLIWIKPTANPPNENTRVMERAWHNPTIQIGPAPDFYGSIAVNSDQANSRVRGGSWKMKEWSFVALTYDGSNLQLYVNAEMVQEAKVGKPDIKPHSATPPDQGNAIWLGAWKAVGWDFIGVLDEAGAFNVVLSDADIKDIMNNGLQSVAAVSNTGKMAMTWGYIKNSR